MRQDKALSLIGLATKAGKTVSGEFMTEREAKAGQRISCDRGGRCIRKYKEKFSEYV